MEFARGANCSNSTVVKIHKKTVCNCGTLSVSILGETRCLLKNLPPNKWRRIDWTLFKRWEHEAETRYEKQREGERLQILSLLCQQKKEEAGIGGYAGNHQKASPLEHGCCCSWACASSWKLCRGTPLERGSGNRGWELRREWERLGLSLQRGEKAVRWRNHFINAHKRGRI